MVGGIGVVGKHRLGVAAICRDEGGVRVLTRLLGAYSYIHADKLDIEFLKRYLESCPEINRSTLISVLKPLKSRNIVSTPLAIARTT